MSAKVEGRHRVERIRRSVLLSNYAFPINAAQASHCLCEVSQRRLLLVFHLANPGKDWVLADIVDAS